MCFFGVTEERKKGKRRQNLTLATATIRTPCSSLEPRVEIRACLICPHAFTANWESSFFLDQAACTAGMKVKQTKEKDWVLSPKELLQPRRTVKAAVGKYWKCNCAMMRLQLLTIRETEKTLQFLHSYSWLTFSCPLCRVCRDSPEKKSFLIMDSMTTFMHTSMNSLCSLFQEPALLLLINLHRYIDCISCKRAMPSLDNTASISSTVYIYVLTSLRNGDYEK